MFSQMVPWLFTSGLFGVVIGLIIGMFIASFQARRNFRAFQDIPGRPQVGYPRPVRRNLDDDDEIYTYRKR